MAKIKRNKKSQHKRFEKMLYSTAFLLMMGFFVSKLFVQSYNVTLAQELRELNSIIQVEQEKVSTMRLEVKQLENRDRIMGMVQSDGLKPIQDNIVAIGD
ncbi:MAG: hypothetical protein ACRDBX_03295 [Erysipelotrichaceae bacterium]